MVARWRLEASAGACGWTASTGGLLAGTGVFGFDFLGEFWKFGLASAAAAVVAFSLSCPSSYVLRKHAADVLGNVTGGEDGK